MLFEKEKSPGCGKVLIEHGETRSIMKAGGASSFPASKGRHALASGSRSFTTSERLDRESDCSYDDRRPCVYHN